MSQDVLVQSTDRLAEQTEALIERIFPAPRTFAVRFWNGAELPGASTPSFTLVMKHPGALRRMFSPPIELSLGEA